MRNEPAIDGPDLPAAREVVLHAHFDATTSGDTTVCLPAIRRCSAPPGRLEEGQRLLLLDQLRSWCGDSRTKVTVKPVIDLNQEKSAPGYEIPDRIRDHVILRDRTCVFPFCGRPARGCDVDHVTEYDHDAEAEGRPQPGPTDTAQPGRAVPVPPPPQDPLRLALRHGRARSVRMDQSARAPLPPRPDRHHRPRPTRPRSAPDPVAAKMTPPRPRRPREIPPHTPPPMRRRGHRHVRKPIRRRDVVSQRGVGRHGRRGTPSAAVSHPDLGHRHPEGLGLAVAASTTSATSACSTAVSPTTTTLGSTRD